MGCVGELLKRGYQAVYTPHIGKTDLFVTSGHYPYYEHGLFPTMHVGEHAGDEKSKEAYLLKPMNCPFHINIYKVRAAQLSRPARSASASSARFTASNNPANSTA